MDGKLVLVTGAEGFIASHIVQQLLESGCKVRGSVISLEEPERYAALYDIHPKAKENLQLVEAELTDADAWVRAVKDVDYICHVATIPSETPYTHEDEFILPSRQGMMNVLTAASKEKSVKRVVLTSSLAAAMEIGNAKVVDERCWVQPRDIPTGFAYNKSKVIAERAAWAFHESLPSDSRFEMSTVLPGWVLGPAIYSYKGHTSASLFAPKIMLENTLNCAIPVFMSLVDVRDVAKMHVTCLTSPEAPGRRFIGFSERIKWEKAAEVLSKEFGPLGYNVSTEVASPEKFKAMCDENRQLYFVSMAGQAGRVLDNSKTRELLQWEPIETSKSLIDSAYALIELGVVKKTSEYKGPGNN